MNTAIPQYDRGIVPAETAARKYREGESFGTKPQEAVAPDSIITTDGYTLDREGLVNNYAVEPEMYIDVPGDLREKEAELARQRAKDLNDLRQDGQGKLTMDGDTRSKGPGLV